MKRYRLLLVTTFTLTAALSLCGCGKNGNATETTDAPDAADAPDATGKTVVMIIAPQKFRDEELFDTKKVLEDAGATVKVASTSLDEATGMLGGTVTPDILVKDVKVADFDAVLFIGGSGASVYWDDATAHAIAKDTVKANKILGAICIAPVTLAKAGVLKDKNATVWKSEKQKLEDAGATYTGAAVEVDGKIITANGPKAAKQFGRAIANALAVADE